MAKSEKPMKIFKSILTKPARYYAASAYREIRPGVIAVTGKKYDVTDQVEQIIRAEMEPLAFGYAWSCFPQGCRCANNDDMCDWHKAAQDWLENDSKWRVETAFDVSIVTEGSPDGRE